MNRIAAIAAIFAAVLLSSCASQPGAMGGGPPGEMGMMDQKAMCDHFARVSAMSPDEQRKMMREKMPSMSPEMMQRHREMMRERCKPN